MKNILITGGAGFIGSNLALKLLKRGDGVTSLDNYCTGNSDNLTPCKKFESFKEIEHDVNQPYESTEKIDFIYHLACPASPPSYQKDPVNTTLTCVLGTYHVLELARKHQATVLFSSTSEVYGDPEQHPQKESYRGSVNTIGIRSCYDEGKRVAESLCFDYHRQYSVNIKVVRIFNTYGENMNPQDGRVVSNFINQAIRGEDLTLYGEGNQTRSFCYIQDLLDGIIAMAHCELDWKGPVNLGNPHEFTIRELAEKIITLTHSSSKLIYRDYPQDDPTKRCPDITLAKEKLKWDSKIDLETGLLKTIDYFSKIKESKC